MKLSPLLRPVTKRIRQIVLWLSIALFAPSIWAHGAAIEPAAEKALQEGAFESIRTEKPDGAVAFSSRLTILQETACTDRPRFTSNIVRRHVEVDSAWNMAHAKNMIREVVSRWPQYLTYLGSKRSSDSSADLLRIANAEPLQTLREISLLTSAGTPRKTSNGIYRLHINIPHSNPCWDGSAGVWTIELDKDFNPVHENAIVS